MSLAERRINWSARFMALYFHAQALGSEEGFHVAIGETKRPWSAEYGHPQSTHKAGLAGHLIIYTEDYKWMNDKNSDRVLSIYHRLHDFWDLLGGSDRIENDLNHFSDSYQGVR